MNIHLIYITTMDKAEARAIGRHLVESRLVACVNIFDNVNSMYIWQDRFQDDQETVLIAKTTESQVAAVIEAVKAKHSYDCPCIVSLPIVQGSVDYLEWIAAQVE